MEEKMLASFWNLIHLYSKNKNFKIKNIYDEEYYIYNVNFYENNRGIIHMKLCDGRKDLVIYTHGKNIVCLYDIETDYSSKDNRNFFTEMDMSSIDYLLKNFDFEKIF